MELPVIEFPAVGRMGIIAIIALTHIIFANLIVGGPVIALAAEYIGLKTKDRRYDELAKSLAKIMVVMMSLGGILGVALVALNIGLFPTFFAKTVNVFFWPLFIEVIFFIIEFGFLALYRYKWDALENRRGLHMAYGIIGAVGAWGSAIVINAAASFMMTPGKWIETQNLMDAIFNPTMLPSILHRILGSFAVAGLIVMMLVMKSKDKDYRSWGIKFGAKWAIYSTVLNVFPGLWYFYSVPEFSRVYILGGAPKATAVWVGAITLGVLAVGLLTALFRKPERYKNLWVVAPFVLIVLTIWGMGFTREAIRKPYLVVGAIYANEISVGEEGNLVKNGALKGQASDGRLLFAKQCSSCHTHTGFSGAMSLAGRFNKAGLKDLLTDPGKYNHPYMPPFFGTQEELDSLVEFIKK